MCVCVCVFCGECGCICMFSICVADSQLWLLWLNERYHYERWSAVMDYMAHICMIIICIISHISVWLLTIINNVWMSGNISVCLAFRVCMWLCTTYEAIFFSFFLFISQIKLFLLYVLVVK